MHVLLVNMIKELATPDVKIKKASTLCRKGEKAPTYSRVGKNIQKNPWPSSLKGAHASMDILGATECPPKYKYKRM